MDSDSSTDIAIKRVNNKMGINSVLLNSTMMIALTLPRNPENELLFAALTCLTF